MLSFSLFSSAFAVRKSAASEVVTAIANRCAVSPSRLEVSAAGVFKWHQRVGLVARNFAGDWARGGGEVIKVSTQSLILPVSERGDYTIYAFVAPFPQSRAEFTEFSLTSNKIKQCNLAVVSVSKFHEIAKCRVHDQKNQKRFMIRSVHGVSEGERIFFAVGGQNNNLVGKMYNSMWNFAGGKKFDVRRIGLVTGNLEIFVEKNWSMEIKYSGESEAEICDAIRSVYIHLYDFINVTDAARQIGSVEQGLV